MVLQMARKGLDIGLGAQDVVTGVGVTGLGQGGQCTYAEVLDQQVFAHAAGHFALQPFVLVGQAVAGVLEFEVGTYPRQHDGRLDRLGDVVHGPQFEPVFFVLSAVHSGDEDHRDVVGRRVGAQLPQDLVAIHARHHHVKQDEVGARVGVGGAQGAFARVGCPHVVVRPEQFAQHDDVLGRVVHDQHGLPRVGCVFGRKDGIHGV